MNKLKTIVVSGLVAAMSFASIANSIEIRAGVTGNASAFYGNVTETLKDSGKKTKDEALAVFKYASGFAEVGFDSAYGITVGLEYVPDAISLPTADRVIACSVSPSTCATGEETGTQTIQADVKDLMTAYIAIPVMETGLYVKAGLVQGSLDTKETLATGSNYGNTDIEGTTVGMFYDGSLTDMFFYRLETSYTEFDDLALNGSEVGGTAASFNKITAKLTGVKAAVSLNLKHKLPKL